MLEAEHNKQGSGGVISQSAQFAPFSHDYIYLNDTEQEWKVYNPSISWANEYRYVSDLQVWYIADNLLGCHLPGDLLCQLYPFVFDRISSYDTFCPIDNKLSLVSHSSPLTSSRDQEGLSIPLVRPDFFPFSDLFSSRLCRLRILRKSQITPRWVHHMANGQHPDDQDGCGCSRT